MPYMDPMGYIIYIYINVHVNIEYIELAQTK